MNRKHLKILAVLLAAGSIILLAYTVYRVKIPTDNYITMSMRGFGADNYMVLDLKLNELSIYSPGNYNYFGMLLNRKLTKEEIELVRAIFYSKEYLEVPEFNIKVAADAEEIHIRSRIKGKEKRVDHILSENITVKRIINLYNRLNIPGK